MFKKLISAFLSLSMLTTIMVPSVPVEADSSVDLTDCWTGTWDCSGWGGTITLLQQDYAVKGTSDTGYTFDLSSYEGEYYTDGQWQTKTDYGFCTFSIAKDFTGFTVDWYSYNDTTETHHSASAKRLTYTIPQKEFKQLPTLEGSKAPSNINISSPDDFIYGSFANTITYLDTFRNRTSEENLLTGNYETVYNTGNISAYVQIDWKLDDGDWLCQDSWAEDPNSVADDGGILISEPSHYVEKNQILVDLRPYDDGTYQSVSAQLLADSGALKSFTDESNETVTSFDTENHVITMRMRYMWQYYDNATESDVNNTSAWSESVSLGKTYDGNQPKIPTTLETPVISDLYFTYDNTYPVINLTNYIDDASLSAMTLSGLSDFRRNLEVRIYDEVLKEWTEWELIDNLGNDLPWEYSNGLYYNAEDFSTVKQEYLFVRPETKMQVRLQYNYNNITTVTDVYSKYSNVLEGTISEIKAYPVTTTSSVGGKIYITGKDVSDYVDGDTQDNTSKAIYCYANDTVNMTFEPQEPAYELYQVKVDGTDVTKQLTLDVSNNLCYKLENTASSHTVEALFKPTGIAVHTVTIKCGENGDVSPQNFASVFDGYDQSFYVYPDADYALDKVIYDGVTYDNLTTKTYDTRTGNETAKDTFVFDSGVNLYNVTKDHTIELQFVYVNPAAEKYYYIDATYGEGGTTSPSNSVDEAGNVVYSKQIVGNDCTVQFLLAAFYEVDEVYVDGVLIAHGINYYTFTGCAEGSIHKIHVTFKALPTNKIKINLGEGGTISDMPVDGILTVLTGSSKSFEVTPNVGYKVKSVKVNGVETALTLNRFMLENITKDTVIDVEFEAQYFEITASFNNIYNGTALTPSGIVRVKYGESQTFTFMLPKEGYYISSLTVDGAAVTNIGTSYTFDNVTANHTIQVEFAAYPANVTINFSYDGNTYKDTLTVDWGTKITVKLSDYSDHIPAGYTVESATINGTAATVTGNYVEVTADGDKTVNIKLIKNDFIWGDVDMNGSVTSFDALMILKYSAESIDLTAEQLARADVSGDGKYSSYDSLLILKFAAEAIDKFPVELK